MTSDLRVRFLRGGEHVVTADEVKPCSIVPGQRVMCNWPWWGPWSCAVISYHAPTQYLRLTDRWGSTTTCHIADVWLEPERKSDKPAPRTRVVATFMGASAVLGGLVGSLITALLMR